MHMVALANRCDYAADVRAVLDHRIADRKVLQRDLVAYGHILVADGSKLAVILGHDAEHVGAFREILDYDDADVIAAVMHQQVGYLGHGCPSVNELLYKI